MPVILRVHELPRLPCRDVATHPRGALTTIESRPGLFTTELRIPHLWGLEPLERIAEFLALERRPPNPWDPRADPPDRGCQAEYLDLVADGEVPRPSALLSAEAFIPSDSPADATATIPPSIEGFDGDVAFLDSLEREVGELLDFLEHAGGLPETLADAARDVEADPDNANFSLEKYSALALKEACRRARDAELPLVLDHEPARKPVEQSFSSWTAHLYGFDRFRSARIGDAGRSLVVELTSDYRYRVPADYLSRWFGGQAREGARIERAEVCGPEGEGLRIFGLSDEPIEFSPLHFLRRCEPTFEEFGDLTDEERERLSDGLELASSFRVAPPGSE